MRPCRFSILLVLLVCSIQIRSQTFYGINYSVANGLSSNEVYDIFQDSRGYIWAATDRGVCRYDGYSFRQFTTDQGLSDNTAFSVNEDESGRVWFLLSNGQFFYFENDSVFPYKYNKLIHKQYPGKKYPRTFFIDKEGNVMAGFLDMGINRITASGSLTCVTKTAVDLITYYGELRDGKLSLGSALGKHPSAYDSITIEFKNPENKVFSKKVQYGDSYNNITGLNLKNGTVLLAYGNSIYWVDKSGKNDVSRFDETICALSEDTKGNVWIGFIGGGVRKYLFKTGEFIREQSHLPDLSVTNILEDHEGGFWFATLEKGVFYRPSNFFVGIELPGQSRYESTALTTDGDSVVFSGTTDGLVFRSTETQTQLVDGGVETDKEKVNILYYDKTSEDLWIATISHTLVSDSKGIQQLRGTGFPKSFYTDNKGNTGFGSSNNIFLTRDRKFIWSYLACSGKLVRVDAVCYDQKNDKLWAGSIDGLYFIKGKCIEKEPSYNYRINCLALSKSGELISGTNGHGIHFIGSKRKVTTDDGLTGNCINALAVDESGDIWAATNLGLNWISMSNDSVIVRTFTISNGLLSNKINSVLCVKNKVWVATEAGTFYFNPKHYISNNFPPPLYIESVMMNGSRLDFRKPLQLEYWQNNIEIYYTGLAYRTNAKVLYRYRFSNGEWKYTRSRQLVFPSLAPGSYELEIYARNENGVWSKVPAKLKFCILQPYYKNPWLLFLLASVFCVVVFYYISFRIKRLREKNELNLKLAELRQQALYTQLNPHFVFNILNSIQSHILTDDREAALKNMSRFAKLMRAVLQTSSKKNITLKEETEILNMYLELNALRFRNKFTYEVETENIADPLIRIPGMLVQPFVENAIIHGVLNNEDHGHIHVKFFINEKQKLICVVDDDGIGMKKSRELRMVNNPDHESTGMELSTERLRLVCQEMKEEYNFSITDKSLSGGRGTLISFIVPYFPSIRTKADDDAVSSAKGLAS